MSDPFDKKLVAAYGSIVDEVKSRLTFDWALEQRLPKPGLHIAISDFCCLQYRKIFEAIALGCLIAQSEHPEATVRLKKMYRADQLVDVLEKLDPDFYPQPCKVERDPARMAVFPAKDGHWLTKANLKKLYFAMDDALHVGGLTKRKDRAEPYTTDSLLLIRNLIFWLLEAHTITLFGGRRRLVVELYPAGGENALITFQTKRS